MPMSEDSEVEAKSSSEIKSRFSDAEQLWNFLGLQIARKTEIIALAAFSLSISTLLWQIINYAVGPVVRLFPTDQIVITATDKLGRNYSGQDNLLALIATMAYVNEGDAGHNAVIRREYLEFSMEGRRVQHRWYKFGSSDAQNGNLTFEKDIEARPFAVNAGSAVSHETLFAASVIDCQPTVKECVPGENFVRWDDFLKAIMTTNQLLFSTSADVFPSKRVTASCVVRLRDYEIKVIEQKQWLVANCTDVENVTLPQRKARRQ
jgi:hypothetical protein